MINAGLYKLPCNLFFGVEEKVFSLEKHIFSDPHREFLIKAVNLEGDFFDIGIPEDYKRFCNWHKARMKADG